MKRLYTLFTILIALGSFLSAAEAQNAEAQNAEGQNVEFPDKNLAGHVRKALGLWHTAPIPAADLATLTHLYASFGGGITNLTGLEHATALTSLNLGYGPGEWSFFVSNNV